jgi:hypothetical protein
MDPNNYEQPGIRLPEPLTGAETTSSAKPEKVLAVSPEVLLGQNQPTPVASNPVMPLSPVALQPATDQPDSTSSVATPSMADDADLIEKEWVIKAKAIVERTKDDPHQQNTEISHIKADYLKKRYNKDIKISSNES